MPYSITFSEEKNQLLLATRQICFEDIILAIKNGKLLADKEHPNPRFKHQRMYIVKVEEYVYAVPYIINDTKRELFLKTIYPSRVLTKKYLKERK